MAWLLHAHVLAQLCSLHGQKPVQQTLPCSLCEDVVFVSWTCACAPLCLAVAWPFETRMVCQEDACVAMPTQNSSCNVRMGLDKVHSAVLQCPCHMTAHTHSNNRHTLPTNATLHAQVTVDVPDQKGRLAILQVHARNKKFDGEVDLKEVAMRTPGFAGADLSNLLNEAAILAGRRGLTAVTNKEIDDSIDRIVSGAAVYVAACVVLGECFCACCSMRCLVWDGSRSRL